jgi:serine-type D-Ala-D-Ala carboxypeptidase/endopeptidase (penicillin-binding protein 4)
MKQRVRLFIVPLLAIAVALTGWVTHSLPSDTAFASQADSARRLQADLDRIFSDPQFANALWGVQVYSLDRSEMLYEKNSTKLLIPASNMKIITAAVALVQLGPDYRFKTQLLTDGKIAAGELKGNLIVAGFGDPSSSSRNQQGNVFQPFRDWASNLKRQGIQAISGDIIADGSAFEDRMFGNGWEWNDLAEGYAAPISALQFNENLVWLDITPGSRIGSPASIRPGPLADYLSVDNKVITGTEGSAPRVDIERTGSGENLTARGTAPLKGPVTTRSVAVQDPVRYYTSALKRVLAEESIDVSACGMRETRGTNLHSLSLLFTHSSPPFSEIIKPLLKLSQNLSAETAIRTLGLEVKGAGTFSMGSEVVDETLTQMGVDKESYSCADGSGLSRLNLASADAFVRILKFLYHHQQFSCFYTALPVAGVDGTLATRMKGTKAENNVHAKTGSVSNVSAISGYIRTVDDEMLAFSILANNFLGPKARADRAQDKALERVAGFSRK